MTCFEVRSAKSILHYWLSTQYNTMRPEICRQVAFLCPQAVGGGRFPLQGCIKSAYSVSLSVLLDRLHLRLMLIKISGSVVLGFFYFYFIQPQNQQRSSICENHGSVTFLCPQKSRRATENRLGSFNGKHVSGGTGSV